MAKMHEQIADIEPDEGMSHRLLFARAIKPHTAPKSELYEI
jgi:hypothetical protein